jgi:uracil-DNA glycosylase
VSTTPGKRAKKNTPPPAPVDEIYGKLEERAIAESNDLNRRVVQCQKCRRGEFLPTVGSGHPLADIFLLKFSPRYLETSEGVAFFGRAGTAVLKSMERLGVDPLLLYGTNVVKCAGVEPEEGVANCAVHLLEELHITQPKLLVVMGESALEALNAHAVAGMNRLEWLPGRLQEFTAFCRALVTPDIDLSLDDRQDKVAFWNAFRSLGDWFRDEPPY